MKKKIAIPVIAILTVVMLVAIAGWLTERSLSNDFYSQAIEQQTQIRELIEIIGMADNEVSRLDDIIEQLGIILFLQDTAIANPDLPVMQRPIDEAWGELRMLGFERPW